MTVHAARELRRRRRSAWSASARPTLPPTSRGACTRPTACSSTSPARSARSRCGCRSRSATTTSPPPRRSSFRCPRCSTTGSAPAASTSASSARPRSTATATSTRRSSATYDHPKVRLPGAGGAPEIAAASAGSVIVLLRHSQARVRRASSTSSPPLGREPDGDGRPDRHHRPGRPAPEPRTASSSWSRCTRGVELADVREATGWPLRVREPLGATDPPTDAELSELRALRARE